MSYYAWTQDLPINAEMYREIVDRMGDSPMPGLVVHLAMEGEDGSIRYLDVWESKEAHDRAIETVVHPAVGAVLTARGGGLPAVEPPRTLINVIDVRLGDRTLAAS